MGHEIVLGPKGYRQGISQRCLKPVSNFDPAQDADLTYTPIIFSKDSAYAVDVGDDRKQKGHKC